MLPFGVTIPATVPQGSEIPEGLMNNPVYYYGIYSMCWPTHTTATAVERCANTDVVLKCVSNIIPSLSGAFPKSQKATKSFVTSVRLSAWNNSAPTGWIFMELDI
jgi:hypothetical protein